MRIAHVLHAFGTGGLEKGVATVVRNASPGFEHVIVCLTRAGESERMLPAGTRVVEMNKPPGNSLRFLWRLSRALKAIAPDVVHTRNWGGLDGVVAARLAGLRAVVHGEHGWDVADTRGAAPRRRRFRRFLARWIREFTCVSRDMATWLRDDVGVSGSVTQIYNGVDTERFRPGPEGREVREELGLGGEQFVIGTIGRLDPIKDHPTLFDAFTRLAPGAALLVVGDGPERGRLEALARDGIRLLGNRLDVPRILRALDVFALTSLNEGISNTILEAMASGLPVVATNVGGNPELVRDGETGALVPAGDAAAIGAALSRYGADATLRRADGDAGRRRAIEHFSVRAMVEGYETVWRRVAAGA